MSLLQLKFDGRMNWLFLDLTAIYKWGSEEQRKERGKDQVLIEGRARTQSPTLTNYAPEFPTFGEIAGFNATQVQWWSLDLKELPCWSQYPLSQVSMPTGVHFCDWSKSMHLKPSTMLYLKWTTPKWNLVRKMKVCIQIHCKETRAKWIR